MANKFNFTLFNRTLGKNIALTCLYKITKASLFLKVTLDTGTNTTFTRSLARNLTYPQAGG